MRKKDQRELDTTAADPATADAVEAGFSLLEVLIALTIMATAMTGILALYGRAFLDGVQAAQTDEVTARATQYLEDLALLPLDADALSVPRGEDERQEELGWLESQERWVSRSSLPEGYRPRYWLEVRVRQFAVDALSHGGPELEADERLTETEAPNRSHLKEIRVRVRAGVGGIGRGPRRSITLRLLRAV